MVYILTASVIISLQRAKFQFLVFAFIMYNRFALHVKKKCIYERSLYGGCVYFPERSFIRYSFAFV